MKFNCYIKYLKISLFNFRHTWIICNTQNFIQIFWGRKKSPKIHCLLKDGIPGLQFFKMKNAAQLLNSLNVSQKIEITPIFQLDNPIISKVAINFNNIKRISQKKKKIYKRIISSELFISNLRKSSVEYHKSASRRYLYF